mmetsp:Transcript_5802/g.8530  ORF Transcript_5802/g.8530 Transcript_5802/m.8530 type:complete len:135 (+) Transcript_5802:54-458(+)
MSDYDSDSSDFISEDETTTTNIQIGGNKSVNLSFSSLKTSNVNNELQKEKLLVGEAVKVVFLLPDGSKQECEEKIYSSSTVEHLKDILESKYNVAKSEQIELILDGEALADPLSLSDVTSFNVKGENQLKVVIS